MYEISNKGQVKRLERTTIGKDGKKYHRKERILKASLDGSGYLKVHLFDNESREKTLKVHRLVAKAFISNPEDKSDVNHKDEIKTNNCVENLEWMTHKENLNYGTRTERARKTMNAIDEATRKAIGESIRKALSKPVVQYSKDGELIQIWSSINEAGRQLGISHGNISLVVQGKRKTCGGFVWKYVEEY